MLQSSQHHEILTQYSGMVVHPFKHIKRKSITFRFFAGDGPLNQNRVNIKTILQL